MRRALRRITDWLLPPATGSRPAWVRVAHARQLPEAELLASLVRAAGIPVIIQRPRGVDVPEMLAGGPRNLLVRAADELEARALLDPYVPITDADRPPEEVR